MQSLASTIECPNLWLREKYQRRRGYMLYTWERCVAARVVGCTLTGSALGLDRANPYGTQEQWKESAAARVCMLYRNGWNYLPRVRAWCDGLIPESACQTRPRTAYYKNRVLLHCSQFKGGKGLGTAAVPIPPRRCTAAHVPFRGKAGQTRIEISSPILRV